jgi:peptidoglycan/xylan/chitin deacetylase (PgdA/CDA1 family)
MSWMLSKQAIASHIFAKIPIEILIKLTKVRMIFPYYHIISDNDIIHVKHLHSFKNVNQFRNDINFLLKKFSAISLFDLLDCLKEGSPLPDKTFHLTFDDGYREMYDIVAPILLEKGVPATFFISSDFTDNKKLCYLNKASIIIEHVKKCQLKNTKSRQMQNIFRENKLDYLDFLFGIKNICYNNREILNQIGDLLGIDFKKYLVEVRPYLTTKQIKSLITEGFSIGAHSIDHPLYSKLSLSDQLIQTKKSIKFLKKRFDVNYGAFAFPHSDINIKRNFFDEIFNKGLVDISFGTSGIINDIYPNSIQRISMEKPLLSADRILSLQFARKKYRDIRSTNRIIRESLF